MRRWLAVAASMMLLTPTLGPVAPAAAVPRAAVGSSCDADGDGVSGGVVGEVVSSGADDAARDLATLAGMALGPARAAHRWRVPVCQEMVVDGDPTTEDRRVQVVGPAVQELRPEAAGWERSALDRALASLRPQLFRPGAWTSPHVAGVQVVGLETWLAVDPGTWRSFAATERVGEVDVTATATPRRVVWQFSDGVVEVCDGPGVQWSPGSAGPAPCGRDFSRSTAGQPPMILEVRLEYEVVWSSTIGGGGTLVERGEPNRYELVVGEVQTYLTDGSRGAPPGAEALPLPGSSQPVNDSDCGWSKPWECSPADIVDAVTDLAVDVVWASLPQPVKDALEMVWSFLEGCASFVGDSLGSVKQVFSQLGQVITDPQGFIDEKLDLARSMFDAIREDPVAFAKDVLGDAIEVELLQSDPAKWAGKIGCELAAGILTGGAAALAGRFANKFADMNKFLGQIREWLDGRRNGDGDGDGDGGPGTCSTSSFPTGTEVLLADGARRAIELVRPGDIVLAFDPGRGSWVPRAVLHQWSYLDTDEMATLRLVDGSTVSATDHHRFWSDSRRRFTEAELLAAGERLATPAGPVSVASVSIWPSGPTQVWELTVAVDHTFAVLAGPHAVAVHNRCDPPPSADSIDDALAGAPDLEGISRADVEGAWDRYTSTDDPDTWLQKYIRARRMSNDGIEYENQVRGSIGLSKNNDSYQQVGSKEYFIPDAVPSKSPLHFVEVKRYETTPLQPNSNAGDQIRYLQQWAIDNPGQTPRFDLYISNRNMISPSFQRLLDAARSDVAITVTEIAPT